ncbi:MAG: Rrf2 family transcriptional regulator [Thiobacillus sp.]|nr:Rrf2 family transcriptional regulator [Thiobacillus sp.]
MIINRSTQYTLQVMMHLVAHPTGRPMLARELAEQLHIPPPYLAKLLQLPCRAGWLSSMRGRGGGFTLVPGAENVTLLEVLMLTKGERISRECLLGFKECDDKTACVMHIHWKPIKQELLGQFGGYTLAQLATAQKLPSGLLPGKKPVRGKCKLQ